jgi:hypothetical protein
MATDLMARVNHALDKVWPWCSWVIDGFLAQVPSCDEKSCFGVVLI